VKSSFVTQGAQRRSSKGIDMFKGKKGGSLCLVSKGEKIKEVTELK
jgi:hypothetical protein